jgi:catechol 2,3-dioxygenase-like lactoylglutathione lyase family enzyme
MPDAYLEHVNITVFDPEAAALDLVKIFGWKVRWSGPSLGGGRTVHVGGERFYVALFAMDPEASKVKDSYRTRGAVNHVAVVVDDLQMIEERVVAAGLEPQSHQTYEPGSRFYFYDREGVEFEVVSYS